MSSSDLDGEIAFDKVLDRYENCIRNEGAEREKRDQWQDKARQAERERDGANGIANHWEAVAGRRANEITALQARCSQLADKIRALGFDVPDEPAVPAPLSPAPEKKPTDDDIAF